MKPFTSVIKPFHRDIKQHEHQAFLEQGFFSFEIFELINFIRFLNVFI